jgi:hypothetical protein
MKHKNYLDKIENPINPNKKAILIKETHSQKFS